MSASAMRWSSEDLAWGKHANRRLEEIPELEWIQIGRGPRGRGCGTSWRNFTCSIGGEILSVPVRCDHRDCPNDADQWVEDTLKHVVKRLRSTGTFRRIRFVRPAPRTAEEMRVQRADVIAEAKRAEISGGTILATVRQTRGIPRITWHVVFSVVRKVGRPIDQRGLRALLTHAAIVRGSSSHGLVWWGDLSYRKRPKITFPRTSLHATEEKYFSVVCREHGCRAIYSSTTRRPMGSLIDVASPDLAGGGG